MQEDPEAKRLIKGIKEFLKEGRKMVIFTEYADTALHLKDILEEDRLSEGFNLSRAGAVINYDIPWNPVRVIQRVGRIYSRFKGL